MAISVVMFAPMPAVGRRNGVVPGRCPVARPISVSPAVAR